jgi:hypothetical protein
MFMSKKLQLSIPTPCHENWDNMTLVQQGKFCVSCQKQVTDFSNMSDREIATFFKKPSVGSVCGRFMQEQLDRDIEIPKKRIPWVKYFFQFALPAFLFSMKATAQGKVKVISGATSAENCIKVSGRIASIPKETLVGQTLIMPIQKQNIDSTNITGKVVDEMSNPISYASVMIKGTNFGVAADSNGTFKIERTFVKNDKDIIMQISSVGFNTKDVVIDNGFEPSKDLIIQLTADTTLQGVIVTGYTRYRVGRLTTGSVSKITYSRQKKEDKSLETLIKVYPNPVKTNSTLNIEWKQTETGSYMLQLLNTLGQSTFAKEMYIDDEARVLNLQLPSVAAGNYFLRMTNKKSGKSYTEKIIIQ